ncbi:MAG: MDR family MFS transporter [Thermaerobacter sp.]|nr:MDR family MFS transporter [Thermaerobacter sp.]
MQSTNPVPAQQAKARKLVLLALILAMGLAALDSTIVSTALPTIVGELGGFAQFSWVFSLYLLTQTATIPIFGRLSDMYGRKMVLAVSILIFMGGSALCGLSTSMTALIIFRALQGIGAGGLLPVAQTIVGDLYTLEQRARMQGLFSSVWAIAAVLGPLLGGVLVTLSWRLVFYVNVPVTAFALLLLLTQFHESVGREKHRQTLDVPGSVLLLVWVSALILALLQGPTWGFTSTKDLIAFAVAILGLVGFVWRELHTPQPIFSLSLLRIPVVAVGNLGTLLAGGLTIGLTGYIPTFVQGVLNGSPTEAGLVVTAMSIGWPLASTISGRMILRFGARVSAVIGGLAAMAGTYTLLSLGTGTSIWAIAPRTFLVGIGLGFITTTAIVLIQEVVGWKLRGAATGSNLFARMLGSSVFVGVMGGILNASLSHRVPGGPEAVSKLLAATSQGPGNVLHLSGVQAALSAGLHGVFVLAFALAIVAFVVLLFMPHRVESAES